MTLPGLLTLAHERLTDGARTWLDEAMGIANAGGEIPFLARFGAAGRKLGTAPLGGPDPRFAGWAADEAGRVLLLDAFLRTVPDERQTTTVDELYRTGELRERQGIVRGLIFLPNAGRFTGVANEAIRSNPLSLLEAVGCDNPFPAEHLGEDMFNQMVLKMMFNALPLSRVVGLERHRTPELIRMVSAYLSERRAAGRTVPADAHLVTGGES